MPTLSSIPHLYAGNRFKRLTERRKDDAWLAGVLHDERTRFMPLRKGHSLIRNDAGCRMALLSRAQLELDINQTTWVLLGEFNEQTVIACDLTDEQVALNPTPLTCRFEDLRFISELLDRDEAGLLAYARALLLWHQRHRYCGACGAATVSVQAGHARQCTTSSCDLTHFPRLDPAIIVLVTDGDRALLGRQAAWPAHRYSTIAGFVEWGESIEEAVVREVGEETGVVVDEVSYHSSQPWPFPSSLMLGFIAHATSTTILLADLELDDARWFSAEELATGAVTLPPRHALSFQLIDAWYQQRVGRPLHSEPGVSITRLARTSSS